MRDICFVADLWGVRDIWKTSSGNDVLLMTNMCWQTTPPSLAKAKTKTNKGTNKGNHKHRHKDAYAMDGFKTYYYLPSSTDKKYFLIDGLHHGIIDLFCHYYLQSVVQSFSIFCLNLLCTWWDLMWLVWEVMISPKEYPSKQSCLPFSSSKVTFGQNHCWPLPWVV